MTEYVLALLAQATPPTPTPNFQVEYFIKLIAEAGVVGGIAITTLRFLMQRLVKQLDDAEAERKAEHAQLLTWFAVCTKTLLVVERHIMLHDATVHGLNVMAGSTDEERRANAEKKLDAMRGYLDEAIASVDAAIESLEYDSVSARKARRHPAAKQQ